MPKQNIAHENARKAFNKINAIRDINNVDNKKYLSLVRGADTMIHQCGLMQTLAFYWSKKESHHKRLISHILEHMGNTYTENNLDKGYSELLKTDDGELMRKTAQVRSYLLWLKRYAEAILDE